MIECDASIMCTCKPEEHTDACMALMCKLELEPSPVPSHANINVGILVIISEMYIDICVNNVNKYIYKYMHV